MNPLAERDRRVRRVLLTEGLANLSVLSAKTAVGVTTGSTAVLGDALHSLTDLANNGVALLAQRVASQPPDREHPYGHRKFETLAVFGLATLLAVLAVELALRGIDSGDREVVQHGWGLALMLGVLVANAVLALWQGRWARRLDSDLLRADARHTLSDVLVTGLVITGWQLAARGQAWLDGVFTLGVSVLILYLAWGLFRRAIPVLVDRSAADPDELRAVIHAVPGVRAASRVRSQGATPWMRVDVTVKVDPTLPTTESHAIADRVEEALSQRFEVADITVHVEPDLDEPGNEGG